jgi:hypothetical protein
VRHGVTARWTLPLVHGPRQGEASPAIGVDDGGLASRGSELDGDGLAQLDGTR